MQIDGNELAILQDKLDREGKKEEAWKVKQEFLKQVREAGDHCPCPEKCPHHGNCFECVTIHRGHRDHLPMCLWDMVNERVAALSHMTEGTLHAYEERQKTKAAATLKEKEASDAESDQAALDVLRLLFDKKDKDSGSTSKAGDSEISDFLRWVKGKDD